MLGCNDVDEVECLVCLVSCIEEDYFEVVVINGMVVLCCGEGDCVLVLLLVVSEVMLGDLCVLYVFGFVYLGKDMLVFVE